MIREDYVNFETAKLLKDKGFDEPCECLYDTENNDVSIVNGWMDISNSELEGREFVRYSAPTLQMVMKWLREIYDLHIIAYPWRANKEERATHWCCQVYKSFNLLGYEKYTNETPKSYEEACEAAIKYCLENLI